MTAGIHDDDRPVGRVLSRRKALALLASSGALALIACRTRGEAEAAGSAHAADTTAPGCVARPRQTEGPYFVDTRLKRSDIRTDPARDGAVSDGTPLDLTFNVSLLSGGSCTPLAGAIVDVWQCDARGVYSGVRDPQFDTTGQQFLRGHQVTDEQGAAHFVTIYPGWYAGRTVHIHFKVRSTPAAERGYEFTSQLYFPDELNDQILARAPYAERGSRNGRNENDGIFRRGGPQLMVAPVPVGDGYAATFDVALSIP